MLSTAEARRPIVLEAALHTFAGGGFYGTTVADVARAAEISPAYVFKLFASKELLFASTLELCFTKVREAMRLGADGSTETSPDAILDAMGDAYAELLRDRSLLLLQVHALTVADISEIGTALRAGLASIASFAKERSGGSDSEIQQFIAFGQLCHLIAVTHIDAESSEWARIIATGIRHLS